MFCLTCLSLIVYFAILGIFFPSKRKFIKEAIRCFWMKATGKHCTDAFDDLIHNRFCMWLLEHKHRTLANFFGPKRRFDALVITSFIIFAVLNIYLFYLLITFLQNPPCKAASACRIKI